VGEGLPSQALLWLAEWSLIVQDGHCSLPQEAHTATAEVSRVTLQHDQGQGLQSPAERTMFVTGSPVFSPEHCPLTRRLCLGISSLSLILGIHSFL
jgi:hypothetical protein